MGATLDALHRLQSTEDRLRSVREQIESKRRMVKARQSRAANIEKQVADTRSAIRRAQTEFDRFELDRMTREEHVGRLREALNRTKSNKEYAAILTQLNTEKVNLSKLEDSALAALGRAEQERKKNTELHALMEKEMSQVADLMKSAQEAEAKLATQLAALERQREEAADGIPAKALNVFQKACERHEGEAMALVERVHPKRAEYVCSGCNMSVPLEITNSLQSRDEVQVCQTCSRILYLEAPAGALA
ncbi:MAG TPA: C4-type zinc ribbon domain-containing protein [Phycisphaerae bacterium]|nr:C4-type zinc ribbon domain-containing protein [Phycisphaerae bacterium]